MRLRTAEPNGRMGVLTVAVLVYTFAGFWVYWLRTGETTVGHGGSMSSLGGLVWMGPLFAWMVVYFLFGDRGVFMALYLPRSTVDVGDDGLSWWTPTADRQWRWDAIGGVSCLGDGTAQITTVYDRDGIELGSITGPMTDTRTRRAARLPEVVLEVRLDLFEALNPEYPGNGCVRRTAV